MRQWVSTVYDNVSCDRVGQRRLQKAGLEDGDGFSGAMTGDRWRIQGPVI